MPESPIFRIRLDADRRDRWDQYVQQIGMPLGRFVKQVVDHAIEHEADPAEQRRELARLRREMTAIGNNLNQIAFRMNSEVPVAEDELYRELNQLRRVRLEITGALHRR